MFPFGRSATPDVRKSNRRRSLDSEERAAVGTWTLMSSQPDCPQLFSQIVQQAEKDQHRTEEDVADATTKHFGDYVQDAVVEQHKLADCWVHDEPVFREGAFIAFKIAADREKRRQRCLESWHENDWQDVEVSSAWHGANADGAPLRHSQSMTVLKCNQIHQPAKHHKAERNVGDQSFQIVFARHDDRLV